MADRLRSEYAHTVAQPDAGGKAAGARRMQSDASAAACLSLALGKAMSLLQKFQSFFGARKNSAPELASEQTMFIYVKIPDGIGPIDRGEKYEDPLEMKLNEAGLGHVSGGGSQLGDRRPDGSKPIEFCGLDVDVTDLAKALAVLRVELPQLGAPDGTELHYTVGEARLQDSFSQGKWALEQPQTFLHPGFGI